MYLNEGRSAKASPNLPCIPMECASLVQQSSIRLWSSRHPDRAPKHHPSRHLSATTTLGTSARFTHKQLRGHSRFGWQSLPFDQSKQHFCGLIAQLIERLAHRGDRRDVGLRVINIIKSRHRNIFRHAQPMSFNRPDCCKGHVIRAGDYRVNLPMMQLREPSRNRRLRDFSSGLELKQHVSAT